MLLQHNIAMFSWSVSVPGKARLAGNIMLKEYLGQLDWVKPEALADHLLVIQADLSAQTS